MFPSIHHAETVRVNTDAAFGVNPCCDGSFFCQRVSCVQFFPERIGRYFDVAGWYAMPSAFMAYALLSLTACLLITSRACCVLMVLSMPLSVSMSGVKLSVVPFLQ